MFGGAHSPTRREQAKSKLFGEAKISSGPRQKESLIGDPSGSLSSSASSSISATSRRRSPERLAGAREQPEPAAAKEKQEHTMTSWPKRRWVLFIAMSLSLAVLAAALFALLTLRLLDQEDQCYQSSPSQHQPYKLFSTKTAYSTAFQQLNSSGPNQPELPQIFAGAGSLSSLHAQLASDGCRPRQLHYLGRHAARFPDADSVEQTNRRLGELQARIDPLPASAGQTKSNGSVCFDPLAQYKQWATFMSPVQGNLVMSSGMLETRAIARRLKAILPEMFQANATKIVLGTTDELRTAQTALAFVAEFENFQLDGCRLDQFPALDSLDRDRALELLNNQCYQRFLDTFNTNKLSFHKTCRKFHQEVFPIIYHLNLKEPNRTRAIASSISKKLKLSKENQLSAEEAQAIYDVCKFESALSGSSIWCNLFTENDLRLYEYLNDIDDFFNQAYGHPDQSRSACPITRDLMAAFKAVRRADPSRAQPEAHFYFTHSEVIQKVLAASVDLEQDPDYMPRNILAYLKAGIAPKTRQWQTSLFTPFSANLAFILYECPKTGDQEAAVDLDANESPFKVVASLNERPIQLDGCSNVVCDLNQLLTDSRIDREKRCKLEDICKKNIIVT